MLSAVDWGQGVANAWSHVATFVPQFIGFLLILFVGYFVAKAIARILDRVLERVGFDRVVERGGVKQALARSQYDASGIVSKIAFWAMFLIVLQLAFGVFGTNPVSMMIAGVVAFLPRLFAAIVILVVAAALGAGAKEIVSASIGGLSYGETVANGSAIAVVAIGFFAALNEINIAPAIVNGLFYAFLAIIVGSAVIAIGGSGIRPLQAKWEQALERGSEEYRSVRAESTGATDRVRARAEQRADQVRGTAQTQVTRSGRRPLRADT